MIMTSISENRFFIFYVDHSTFVETLKVDLDFKVKKCIVLYAI